jgi:hypothetical protein
MIPIFENAVSMAAATTGLKDTCWAAGVCGVDVIRTVPQRVDFEHASTPRRPDARRVRIQSGTIYQRRQSGMEGSGRSIEKGKYRGLASLAQAISPGGHHSVWLVAVRVSDERWEDVIRSDRTVSGSKEDSPAEHDHIAVDAVRHSVREPKAHAEA